MRLIKTPLLAKLLILVVCVFALVTLVTLQGQIREQRAKIETLDEQIMYGEQEQRELQEDIAALGSDESIIKIAQKYIGMVGKDWIMFYDSANN